MYANRVGRVWRVTEHSCLRYVCFVSSLRQQLDDPCGMHWISSSVFLASVYAHERFFTISVPSRSKKLHCPSMQDVNVPPRLYARNFPLTVQPWLTEGPSVTVKTPPPSTSPRKGVVRQVSPSNSPPFILSLNGLASGCVLMTLMLTAGLPTATAQP